MVATILIIFLSQWRNPLPLWLRHNGELSVSFVRSRKDTTEIMKTALEEKRQQS